MNVDRSEDRAPRGSATPELDRKKGAAHLENESWLRAEIANGSHIIDIGIDSSRMGSRSPYYELERRIIAETGYPVEYRSWPPSENKYSPEYEGPCP
jgi:hypothetical protein